MDLINSKEFSEKLKILSLVSDFTPNTIAVVVFNSGNQLIARGKNIQIELGFEHNLDYYFAVGIEKLTKLFNEINFDVRLLLKDNVLEIKAGKFRSKLPLINQEESYLIQPSCRSEYWLSLPESINRAFDVAKISLSKEKGFTTVLDNFGIVENMLITTDHKRCTVFSLEESINNQMIITPLAARLITDLGLTHYSIGHGVVEFKSEVNYLKTAKIVGDFPKQNDFKKIFDSGFGFEINREELIQAIEKVKIFSDDQEITGLHRVKFEVDPTKVLIYCQNSFGLAKEKINVVSSGTKMFKANANFMLDILKKLKGEVIKIELSDMTVIFREDNFKHAIAMIVEE